MTSRLMTCFLPAWRSSLTATRSPVVRSSATKISPRGACVRGAEKARHQAYRMRLGQSFVAVNATNKLLARSLNSHKNSKKEYN